jgi:hypothetical protein
VEKTKKLPFNVGEFVICVINSRASLTIGKEYEIIDVYGHSSTDIDEVWERFKNEITLVIKNDKGENTWYDHMRFVPKSEFRSFKINEILK